MSLRNDLENLSSAARMALSALESEVKAQIDDLRDSYSLAISSHLTLLFQNNGHKQVSDIMNRADVASLFRSSNKAFERAAKARLLALHTAASLIGRQTFVQQMELYGSEAPESSISSAYLDQILSDLSNNLILTQQRIQAEILSRLPEIALPASYQEQAGGVENTRAALGQLRADEAQDIVRRASRNLGFRTKIAASVVVRRSAEEIKLVSVSGWRKMWVASFVDNVPCDHCIALHGTVIGIDEEFNAAAGNLYLRVYGNLQTPPRHPNCRCTLWIIPPESTEVSAPKTKKVVKPVLMSSEDVQSMPLKVFAKLIAALKSVVKVFRSRRGRS